MFTEVKSHMSMSVPSVRILKGLSLDLLSEGCLLHLFRFQVGHLVGVVESCHLPPLLRLLIFLERKVLFVIFA